VFHWPGVIPGTIGIDEFAGDVLCDADHVIALTCLPTRAADTVKRPALLVHHIVVFQQVFARVEVLRFHGFLRVLDAPRNEPGLNRHAFRHAQSEHQRFHSFTAEDAHQIVFEGKKEARGTRIALASSAAAKLVIAAGRLVPFAQNVQTAERDHCVMSTLLREIPQTASTDRQDGKSCLRVETRP
jgi:hypothetical protein